MAGESDYRKTRVGASWHCTIGQHLPLSHHTLYLQPGTTDVILGTLFVLIKLADMTHHYQSRARSALLWETILRSNRRSDLSKLSFRPLP